MTLLQGIFAVVCFFFKLAAIIIIAIYYLVMQLLVGIDPPNHDKYKAFDPIWSPQLPPEPSQSKLDAQIGRYERTERAKYIKAIEQKSVSIDELPF